MGVMEFIVLVGALSFGVHFISNKLVDVYEESAGPIIKKKKKKRRR